jgi:hypothetical protein
VELVDLHHVYLPAPHVVDRLIDHDLLQPRPKRRLLPELVEVRECIHESLLQSILSFSQMVQYPHADVEHGFRVMFIKLVLRFALSEFTTLYQFDVPVGVNLCFQAEGLYFERSESKTTVSAACCICFKNFFKMPHTEQRAIPCCS